MPPEPVPNVAFWIDGPDGVPIADVKVHGKERTKADAAIIEAGPDMLELLQEMAECWAGNVTCTFSPGCQFAANVRAVIARATGTPE